MQNFNFNVPTNVIFGADVVKNNLIDELNKHNVKKLLLTTGGGSIKRNGVYDDVIDSLNNSNIEVFEFFGIEPNPTLTNLRDAIKIVKENNIDFILSAGGGSSLDATKAISRGSKIDKDIWEVFTGGESPVGNHIKFGTIMTIPATGSEMNAGAVITNDETNEKRANMFTHPSFALLDPTYTFTLPKWQTGAGASDIISHILEQYFTNDDSMLSHEYMFANIRVLKEIVPQVLEDEKNYEMRAQIMWSGAFALNGFLRAGLGNSAWDVHGLEHPLSGFCKITHGAGLAALTPNWMRILKDNERFNKLVIKLGENVFNTNDFDSTVNEVENMFKSFGMPMSLKEIGVKEDLLDTCAEDVLKSRGSRMQGLFKNWDKQSILDLYEKSM